MNVFISHTAADLAPARALADRLLEAGFHVVNDTFLRPSALSPGESIADAHRDAFAEADVLVVLLSAAALESVWVRDEIQSALGEIRFRFRVIPVLLEPVEASMPWILKRLHPIAAYRDREHMPDVVVSALLACLGTYATN